MNLNIAICDDNNQDIQTINRCLQCYNMAQDVDLSVDSYNSGRALLSSYTKSGDYQIVFLDIEMPEHTGLQIAERIRSSIDRHVIIVFVSYHPKYMQDSFRVHPFFYLTKPYTQDDISTLMDDIIADINSRHILYSLISTEKGDVTVNIRDVLYIEVESSHSSLLKFHLDSEVLSTKGTLAHWETELKSCSFFKCYRSILVNLLHIHYFDKNSVILDSGEKIPISRKCLKDIHNQYLNHTVELFNLH